MSDFTWDLFISHAHEDKSEFVTPLAEALAADGLEVWYDDFELTLGDSLRRSIDRGLSESRYGLVVLSPSFLEKEWPQRELDGLASREMNGRKVILPVWHGVGHKEILQYSPTLADRRAISSSAGVAAITQAILAVFDIDGDRQESPKSMSGSIDVSFEYNHTQTEPDEHRYRLVTRIANNTDESIGTFRLVFTFPADAVFGVEGLNAAKPDVVERGVRISTFEFDSARTLYPTEEVTLTEVTGMSLQYRMTHDLFWQFSRTEPVVRWKLYLMNRMPLEGSVQFSALHRF